MDRLNLSFCRKKSETADNITIEQKGFNVEIQLRRVRNLENVKMKKVNYRINNFIYVCIKYMGKGIIIHVYNNSYICEYICMYLNTCAYIYICVCKCIYVY